MSVTLSPIGGVAGQFFDNNGQPLSGGKIYTYAAGTTTPQACYTSAAGSTPHSNPIILDSAGRVPGGEIWLTDSLLYKFVIETSTAILIGTYDNISGINSNFVNYTVQEEVQTATAGQTVFTLTTINYAPGTNSLSVYIDGVNQYVGTSYLETDSTTVTFTSGVHVGAEVKFTTAIQTTTGAVNADIVSYDPPFTGGVTTNVEAKLSEYVSVKDFGAVGDGVADDTAAIQAALDSERGVYIPDGTYIVDVVNVAVAGQYIFGQSNNAIIKRKDNTYGPVIQNNGFDNVVFFGFAIDGNKAGAPFVPATEYDIPSGGVLADNQRGDIVCLSASGNRIENIYFTNSQTSPALFYNMTFSQMFKCQSVGHNREGFFLFGGNDCVIDSCVSLAGSPLPYSLIATLGISGDTQKHNHTVTNNHCYDSQAAFITINTTYTLVANNTVGKTAGVVSTGPGIRFGQGAGIPESVTTGSVADGNVIEGIDDVGSGGTGRGISVEYAGGDLSVQNNTITNCTTGIGVSVEQNVGVKIKDNVIKSVTLGVDLYNAREAQLIGNIVKGCDTGFNISAEDSFIATNYVDTPAVKAFNVNSSSGLNDNILFENNRSSVGSYTAWAVASPTLHTFMNNEYGATASEYTVISGATPNVGSGNTFNVNNAAPTDMTSLSDWKEGAIYTLYFANGNTTLKQAGSFRLKNAIDVTPVAGQIMQFLASGSLFYEVSRSF